MRGYEGLYIVDTTAFLRPVQIVRQFISNHETRIAPYHTYKGLSIAPQNGGESRRIKHIPIDITNPISWLLSICGYKGLKVWI
jgi:hypothetical protein